MVKWTKMKVLVKYVCVNSSSYVIHYCKLCLFVINVHSSILGSLLGFNIQFVFLMCVVYVLYFICNFVCCVSF